MLHGSQAKKSAAYSVYSPKGIYIFDHIFPQPIGAN